LGLYFDHWAGDIGTADAASPTLSLTMRSDRSVNAVFVQGDIPLVVAVEGGGRVAPAPGTYWMRQGESVYCHVYPSGRGAHFDHWEGDIGDAHPEDTNFVLVVDAPKNLTALFDPGDFVLTVKSTPSNMFVSPELGDWGYRNGDTVRVAAGIAPGRLFAGWQGDLISANYTEYLVMDSDKTITATFETAPNEKLVFPDNALEAYFRYAINKPTGDIYLNDCLDRGSLDAQWAGIYSLEGIQKLPWLGRCNAYSNNLTDITPLSAIVGMFASDVTGNQITDISPYSGLPFLSYLNVGGNKITDISGLKDLPDLRTFIAFDNLITDITALAAFPKLRELNLQGNPVASIAPLAGLFYLKSIRMPGCQADDLTPLAGHKQLEILVMTGSLISDLSPLEEDLALRDLALSQCQITDISALENLPNLKRVELNLNTIADLAPLVNNVSFGQGAQLFVEDNPLGPAACDQIAALKARGVFVQHSYLPNCPK
jgi:Leucine-rich repeat (LRR) protein